MQRKQHNSSASLTTLTFEKVWLMFQETDKKFQETDKKFQESERVLTEKFQEMRKESQETSRQMKETDKKFQETDKKMNKLIGNWGQLLEALVAPGCLKLFQERKIKVNQLFQNCRVRRAGEEIEIDVLLVNDTEAVVIETKTNAGPDEVKDVLKDLKRFKEFFPQYYPYKVYGAVASLRFKSEAERYASRKGLFVIKVTGEGLVQIINKMDFKPKPF